MRALVSRAVNQRPNLWMVSHGGPSHESGYRCCGGARGFFQLPLPFTERQPEPTAIVPDPAGAGNLAPGSGHVARTGALAVSNRTGAAAAAFRAAAASDAGPT